MTRRYPIDEVLSWIGDAPELAALLRELREEGLFPRDELEPHECDELRVATLLVRDLGVNAAGVEVALHLRRRLLVLQGRLAVALRDLDDEA